jgi:cysteine desulfurase
LNAEKLIYLDYAATTPVEPAVAAAMAATLSPGGAYGNPSSNHPPGRDALAIVETARRQLADLIGADARELIWTSGATESDNMAIIGGARYRRHRGKHLISMPVEHKAVTDTFAALEREGFELTWLSPAKDGMLDLQQLDNAIRDDTQLVSIMFVNNETGVIQDIERIGQRCRDSDILFHVDAAQAVGKVPIDLRTLPVDLMSLTAHKFYGPKGVGALFVADRPGCQIEPILFGGGHERRLRPGTSAVHQLHGIGLAAEIAAKRLQDDLVHIRSLRKRLFEGISDLPGLTLNGPAEGGFPGILNISAEGVEGESLMLALHPLCVASGSACNAKSGESSYVLRALGLDDHLAQSAIRFSIGRHSVAEDIDVAIERYREAVTRLRRIAPKKSRSA